MPFANAQVFGGAELELFNRSGSMVWRVGPKVEAISSAKFQLAHWPVGRILKEQTADFRSFNYVFQNGTPSV